MKIAIEINNFYELKEQCWSGALFTLECIERAGKEDEFMAILDSYYDMDWRDYGVPTMTEINDFIWFDSDTIFEELGLDSNGEPIEDEDEEDEDEDEE